MTAATSHDLDVTTAEQCAAGEIALSKLTPAEKELAVTILLRRGYSRPDIATRTHGTRSAVAAAAARAAGRQDQP